MFAAIKIGEQMASFFLYEPTLGKMPISIANLIILGRFVYLFISVGEKLFKKKEGRE